MDARVRWSDPSSLIQKQVRENTQDLESYMLDLKAWEDGMKKKEQNIFGNGSEVKMKEPPVTKDDVHYVKGIFEDGRRQMKNGKWELAVSSFTKAINKYQKNPVFFIKRAKCYLKLKKPKEAEVDCTRALSLDPKLLKAKFLRAHAREMSNNYRGACLDLQDILILDPPNDAAKDALNRVRNLHFKSIKSEDSKLFEKEEEDEEESQSAILSSLVGPADKGTEEAELEEKIQRSNIEKQRGNELVKEKKWEEAKEAYSKAILIYPNDAIYYANRALCHLNTDHPSRAILDCSVALIKNPRYVKAFLRRAAARKVTNDLWGARSDVKKILLLEPNNEQAKTLLEELNVLIEQKVYKEFGLQDDETKPSDLEVEGVSNEPTDERSESGTEKTSSYGERNDIKKRLNNLPKWCGSFPMAYEDEFGRLQIVFPDHRYEDDLIDEDDLSDEYDFNDDDFVYENC